MSSPYLGELRLFGLNFAVRGWALCDGQLLPISSNTALFSLLGTTYGGDGRTTFALPDLRGRSPIHVGNGPGLSNVSWGERGGSETTTLTAANLPAHTHAVRGATGSQTSNRPTNGYQAAGNSYSTTADTSMGPTASTGSGQSFNQRDPYLGMYYQIALVGIFPSRS